MMSSLKTKLCLLIIWVTCPLVANASLEIDRLKARVRSFLPIPLQGLSIGSTTSADATKVLGKADLIEGQNYYWALDGLAYSLQLHFSKDHSVLESLNFYFVKNKPRLKDFRGFVNSAELKLISQPEKRKELGAKRYESPSLVLEFDPRLDLLRRIELK